MPVIHYRPGDRVVLKQLQPGSIYPQGSGRVVSLLPEPQVLVRYRIRLDNEVFERTIEQDDIEPPSTASQRKPAAEAASRISSKSWINPDAFRTKK
ncbi:cold-shock protein [Martelella sp. HB161492]|uniref:cold-shock protein n=1 Tax=Martelella sp. HB161492 TaxID=2720726 RepID=UPI0015900639|nr:cold-shock protein [Martelella sp. HB161492]